MKKLFILLLLGTFILLYSYNIFAVDIVESDEYLINGLTVFHQDTDPGKLYVKKGDREILINDYYPSIPDISPDKTRMVYISPYEWEKVGKIYLYDNQAETNEIIFGIDEMPEQNTAKKVYWLNDRYLIVIVGFAYGTISKGGDVYLIDSLTGDYKLYYETELRLEVKDIIFNKEGIDFQIIKFDDQYMEYEIIVETFSRTELLNAAKLLNGGVLQDKNLLVMAYQLEGNLRGAFKNAYNSWINMGRIDENDKQDYRKIITLFRSHLENYTVEAVMDNYIYKLEEIIKGGEGEITFPTHEVLEKAEVIDKGNNIIKVNFLSTRYYPETEWEGTSYSLDFNYNVILIKENEWKIKEIIYQDNY